MGRGREGWRGETISAAHSSSEASNEVPGQAWFTAVRNIIFDHNVAGDKGRSMGAQPPA